jgi:hypothetical protein
MNKQTFVELYLVKYGQVEQDAAEKLVSQFAALYPKETINGDLVCIDGVLGYIKHSQAHHYTPESAAQYILKDMTNAVEESKKGIKGYIPSSLSFWVEMTGNSKMPKLSINE